MDDQSKFTYVPITENDVKDTGLLFLFLRKMVQRVTSLGSRISSLETAPAPPSVQQISAHLQAGGEAPLTVTALPGKLAQPQPASAPVYTVAPSGLVLQQLGDTQLIVVGTTSTGMSLQTVKGGNPNTLVNLSSSLTLGNNLMTLDTIQTSTGAKTLQGTWDWQTPIQMSSTGTSAAPALTSSADTTTGMYSTAAGKWGISASGTQIGLFSTNGSVFLGTSTADSAPAGDIGEFSESVVTSAAPVNLVNNTAATVTSITLTAGDWDIGGTIGFKLAATTVYTQLLGSYSSINNSVGPEANNVQMTSSGLVPNGSIQMAMRRLRFSLTTSTTLYLVAIALFTTSTCSAFGVLNARRAR